MRHFAIALLAGNVVACNPEIADEDPDPDSSDASVLQNGHDIDAGLRTAAADAPPDSTPPTPYDYLQKVVPVLFISAAGKPIVHDTYVNGMVKDAYVDGTLKVVEDHDGSLTGIETRPTTLEVKIGIKVHGSSSQGYGQKSFHIEIRDDAGNDLQVPLLGLPRESDFILSSCYSDKTCVRNALAYSIASEMGQTTNRYWAPRTRFVEVYLEGKYNGLYLLAEKLKKDKLRVPLPDLAPDASDNGGFLISAEGDRNKGPKTWPDAMNAGKFWEYRYPNYRELTDAQKTYIQNAVLGLEKKMMASPKWVDVKKFVDPQSWVDYLVVQEVSNNTDAYFASWYFYKEPDAAGGKFYMGPVWDFDIGFGNIDYNKRYCTNNYDTTNGSRVPWSMLYNDKDLWNDMRCRYNELRKTGGPLDLARLEARLDTYVKHVTRAKMRDVMKWGNIGKYVWPNNYIGATWDDEIIYLRYWLRRRLDWLDKNFLGTCTTVPQGPAIPEPMPPNPPVKETAVRTGICCNGASVYIPIEGAVDPSLAMWACPVP